MLRELVEEGVDLGDSSRRYAAWPSDAVKKEALRRAGIGYVEVVAGDTPAALRQVVDRLVDQGK